MSHDPRAAFIARWKAHVSGIIALGSASVRKVMVGPIESVQQYGQAMLDVTDTSERLLGQLFDDARKTARHHANGTSPEAITPEVK